MPANSLKKEQVCIKSLLLIEFDRSALTFGFRTNQIFFLFGTQHHNKHR